MQIHIVYMTAGNKEEARHIGKSLVESKLAACVNIIDGMNALYVWDGQLQDDTESVMIAKTTSERLPDLIEKVRCMHSYDCPCIVSYPITEGNTDFLNWVVEGVSQQS